jgi:4-hydroxy-3-methylbut-2-enyl diphosphate reductase
MKILRADHLGMCFGVRDAIALATKEAARGPLTVLGDLVHNETVLNHLTANGVRIVKEVSEVGTPSVMITAHGASEVSLRRVRERGLHVYEATCPLVRVAHRAVKDLAGEGYHPVIIGLRGHVEVRGMTEDLKSFDVVLTEQDVLELPEHLKFGVAAQTTQPIERVRHIVHQIRFRFPNSEVRFIDTVCQPTKQRQDAAIRLAQEADVVVVIGGTHSNNTRELVDTCRERCGRVHHVQTADDLRPEWFSAADKVGITAGTSTPDSVIVEVENWLREWSGISEEERGQECPAGPGIQTIGFS